MEVDIHPPAEVIDAINSIVLAIFTHVPVVTRRESTITGDSRVREYRQEIGTLRTWADAYTA